MGFVLNLLLDLGIVADFSGLNLFCILIGFYAPMSCRSWRNARRWIHLKVSDARPKMLQAVPGDSAWMRQERERNSMAWLPAGNH